MLTRRRIPVLGAGAGASPAVSFLFSTRKRPDPQADATSEVAFASQRVRVFRACCLDLVRLVRHTQSARQLQEASSGRFRWILCEH